MSIISGDLSRMSGARGNGSWVPGSRLAALSRSAWSFHKSIRTGVERGSLRVQWGLTEDAGGSGNGPGPLARGWRGSWVRLAREMAWPPSPDLPSAVHEGNGQGGTRHASCSGPLYRWGNRGRVRSQIAESSVYCKARSHLHASQWTPFRDAAPRKRPLLGTEHHLSWNKPQKSRQSVSVIGLSVCLAVFEWGRDLEMLERDGRQGWFHSSPSMKEEASKSSLNTQGKGASDTCTRSPRHRCWAAERGTHSGGGWLPGLLCGRRAAGVVSTGVCLSADHGDVINTCTPLTWASYSWGHRYNEPPCVILQGLFFEKLRAHYRHYPANSPTTQRSVFIYLFLFPQSQPQRRALWKRGHLCD